MDVHVSMCPVSGLCNCLKIYLLQFCEDSQKPWKCLYLWRTAPRLLEILLWVQTLFSMLIIIWNKYTRYVFISSIFCLLFSWFWLFYPISFEGCIWFLLQKTEIFQAFSQSIPWSDTSSSWNVWLYLSHQVLIVSAWKTDRAT